jgi:hypothetical protein
MTSHRHGLFATLVAIATFSPGAEASSTTAESSLEVPAVAAAPRLEDFLGDAPNVPALRIDHFVQRQPGDGSPESEQTVAYLSHDRRALYVVFVCHDRQPESIRANLTKREATLADDLVGIYLDTFHDRRRAYLFLVNPRGIQRDSVVTEGQGEDASFDALWDSRGQLTPTGYVVWMAIPFRSIRFASDVTEVWGVGLTRRIPRTTEEDVWPFLSRRVETLVPQLAPVGGFHALRAGRNIQLIPYATGTAASLRNTAPGGTVSIDDARTGADGKLVWRDRVTVDMTANPDFSQVETDDPQVTINQRYEVYFPEKRPFFLENAALFQTPETLFFSRRIVSPRWGARLTGKAGRWNVGSLFSEDRVNGNGSPAADAFAGAVRVQRDIGRESSVGVLLTSRDTPGDRNLVASIDTRLRVTPHWTFQAQSAASSAVLHDDETRGSAVTAELDRTDRHLSIVNRYIARSPEFTSELGFIPRTDVQQALQVTTYRWRPGSGALLAYGPGVTSSVTWDYGGHALDRTLNPHFGFEFKGATQVLMSGFANHETFAGIPFDYRDAQLNLSSSFVKWMEMALFLQRGGRINYAPAQGLAPFLGATTDGFARVTLRPVTWVALEQSYIVTRLQADAGCGGVLPHTERVFSNELSRTKISVQLTRELSLRTILDYTTVESDPVLTSIQPFRRFNTDVLATYLVNPWTALYVGYTNGLQNLTTNEEVVGLSRPSSLQQMDRQVFVKLSYVLRF